jgi:hypothetical protein
VLVGRQDVRGDGEPLRGGLDVVGAQARDQALVHAISD